MCADRYISTSCWTPRYFGCVDDGVGISSKSFLVPLPQNKLANSAEKYFVVFSTTSAPTKHCICQLYFHNIKSHFLLAFLYLTSYSFNSFYFWSIGQNKSDQSSFLNSIYKWLHHFVFSVHSSVWNVAGIYNSREHHPNSVYLDIRIRLKLSACISSAQESAVMLLKLFTPQQSVQFLVIWR